MSSAGAVVSLRGMSPVKGRPPMDQYSSTSTLLQEISTLRSRLKDLEDDTKSSVVGSPIQLEYDANNMMKKELAQLQEEKAKQEMEFLNQMTRLQVEKQNEVDDLLQKLSQSTANESKLNEQLEKVRREANDLKHTMQGCESEDHFARTLQNLKESHAEEMEQMKDNLVSADKEISESRGEIDMLQAELDEMQHHRQALLDEVTSARMELNQEQTKSKQFQQEISRCKRNLEERDKENERLVAKIRTLETQQPTASPLKVNTSLQAVSSDSEETISPTEKNRLIQDMQELEERLVKFHTRLAEKDGKIDDLTAQLLQERSLTKKLRAGKEVSSSSSTCTSNRSAASSPSMKSSRKPAVAGLVASFERRMVHPVEDSFERHTDSPTSVSFDTTLHTSDVSDLKEKLKNEKDLVFNLQTRLNAEKTKVLKLTDDLREERQTVSDLRSLLESRASAGERDQGNTSQLEKLRAELAEAKRSRDSSISLGAKERSELSRLRSEAIYAKVIRDDLELKLQHDNDELERLRAHIVEIENRGGFQEEKKDVDGDEVAALRSLVAKKEKSLERLRNKHKEYESSTEEKLQRLRNQVEALQSELEKAMSKVEKLEEQLADADDNKIKAETMELDLTMANARNAELLNQHKTTVQSMEEKITTHEKKIDFLEMQNKELTLSMDAPSDYEKECKKLKQQLSNAQDQLEAIETDHESTLKGLKARIHELTNELETERSKASTENNRQDEITRLTTELRRLRLEKTTLEREHADRVEKLEREMETIEMETEQQIEAKQDLIDRLTESLALKEKQTTSKLAADVSFSRKDELKEVNDELLDVMAQNKTYAREIHKLKSTIHELESASGGPDSTSYQRRIQELEDEIIALDSELRQQTDRDSVSKLKNENSQLREFVRELKLERRQLREKCDSGSEKGASSKSSQMLREKNAKLKQEVERLTRRLRKLEDSITRVAV